MRRHLCDLLSYTSIGEEQLFFLPKKMFVIYRWRVPQAIPEFPQLYYSNSTWRAMPLQEQAEFEYNIPLKS